ncbi:bifunctional diguanylate cyclase/phosphodiesterase [Planococcus citreus]|uniref:Diguanylate cyclase (GGDEF)-like protein n=1 Tax=Planococcus citreus TaxID=1373 RepID=A0A497YJ13_9BACL|nr:bifunctional diguanylate cyclase/phosphodiesterase [Planococcus citreus]RLJ90559.1 diguanylate cyclase (GGDEF)-like protein [Planococcus citreus]
MAMFPHISLIFLSIIVSIATSYTVLILIEYVSKRKKAINSRSNLLAVLALGSGFFGIQVIGILTFMAEYQFTPRYWLLALALVTACILAVYVLKILPQGINNRSDMARRVLVTAFFMKAVHFLGLSGVLDVRFSAISPGYYVLSAITVLGISYFSFRFVLKTNAMQVTEKQRLKNATILGFVLTLLYYTSTKTFYTNMALPEATADGMGAITMAVFVASIVALLLLSAANLALVDLHALETETGLLQQVKASESRFRTLAYTDQLTGVPNRHWFFAHFRELMDSPDGKVESVGVVLLDFDDFKSINELIGHDGGDQFLKKVVERLKSVLPATISLARLGGDEFVFAVPNAKKQYLERLCQNILLIMEEPIQIGERSVASGISLGISCQKITELNEESLIKQADLALFMAKSAGKESYEFFSPDLLDSSIRKQEITAALQQALVNGEFSVHYQPQVELLSGRVIGFEALLRWNSALGAVPPSEFIPVAEECGAIHSIGEWVLREACQQLSAWRREGRPDIHVSVNVSAKQFLDPEFAEKVARILIATNVPAECVEIEITESVMIDLDTAAALVEELQEIGVKLAIDDFGTGYSSLNAVKNIQIDTLKIDKSLVDEVLGSDRSMAILATIIELGKNLGADVVVEGLETLEQVTLMRQYEVIGQGYYFSRPLPADKAARVWDKYLEQPDGMFHAPVLY